MCVLVTQSCLTLCNSMDYSLPGSSVHGILQARILGWIALLFTRGLSQPRDQTRISRIAGRFLYHLRQQGSPKPCVVAIHSHKRPEVSRFQERFFFLPQIQAKTDKFPLPCFYARGRLSVPSSFQACTPLQGPDSGRALQAWPSRPTPSLTLDPGGGTVKGSTAFCSETSQDTHSHPHPQARPGISACFALPSELPGDCPSK